MTRTRRALGALGEPTVWFPAILIAGPVLILAAAYVVPPLLVHQLGGITGPEQIATTRTRTSLAHVITAAGVVAGLVFTARTYLLSRTGQTTDRYRAAVAQIGDGNPTIRIGGIYALEQLAGDTRRMRQTVADVLASFVRDRAALPRGRRSVRNGAGPPPDVSQALTVLGRLGVKGRELRIDLSGAVLIGADLTGARLPRVHLAGARLDGANLTEAHLPSANLTGVDLRGARLSRADLRSADLTGADLRGATVYLTDLTGATRTDWRTDGCDFTYAEGVNPR